MIILKYKVKQLNIGLALQISALINIALTYYSQGKGPCLGLHVKNGEGSQRQKETKKT